MISKNLNIAVKFMIYFCYRLLGGLCCSNRLTRLIIALLKLAKYSLAVTLTLENICNSLSNEIVYSLPISIFEIVYILC